MPAETRGPSGPDHCPRRCNTDQSDTAKVLKHQTTTFTHDISRVQSRPRLCVRPPPRTAVLAQLHFSRVAITSTFGYFAGRSTLNKLALRSALTHTATKLRLERSGKPTCQRRSLCLLCDFQINAFGLVCVPGREGGSASGSGRWITKAG